MPLLKSLYSIIMICVIACDSLLKRREWIMANKY